jgi:serine/threonine-protein kinase ATR
MSVIQLNQLIKNSTHDTTNETISNNTTNNNNNTTNHNITTASVNSSTTTTTTSTSTSTGSSNSKNSKKMLKYHHICCQTIFNIYDHLMRQLNYYRSKMTELQATFTNKQKMLQRSSGNNQPSRDGYQKDPTFIKYRDLFNLFNKFIEHIPQQLISKAAFECKAYYRSLMHYELNMRQTPGAMSIDASTVHIKNEHLIELQNTYAAMDEVDAASGILLLKKGSEESLADAAFRHKINGHLNESIACIEQMLESNENAKNDIKQHETYIRTFISVGRHRNALSYLEGLMVDRCEWKEALDSYRIEACWKLGSWDKLKQIINSTSSISDNNNFNGSQQSSSISTSLIINNFKGKSINTLNAGIGRLFTFVAEKKENDFYETLTILRDQQIGPLSAVSMEAGDGGGSYQRGYEYVVNLQALQEIESCLSELFRLRDGTTDREQFRNMLIKNLDTYLIEPWEHRAQTMQPSFKHLEPIYNVRIALLNFISSHLEIDVQVPLGCLWLKLAKIARKAGMFENSYQYMLNAQGQIRSSDSKNLEELLVEKSKWYWQREDKDSALFYLQKGLDELFNNGETNSSNSSTPDSTVFFSFLFSFLTNLI